MKRFILLLMLVLCIKSVPVYADEPVTVPDNSGVTYYNVNDVINNPDSTDVDFLRAILICVRDIDLYIQFFVTMIFAIGLCWYFVLRPIRYFLL